MTMFENQTIEPDNDTHRTCGNCMTRKPVEEFYKDGTDKEGKPRYRRDCKECYRVTRLTSRHAKKNKK